MEYDCFSCLGQNRECIEKRRYVPYSDEDICLYKVIARQDEARLRIRDFNTIKLRQMFAQHLFDSGEKEKAIEILAS